MSQFSYDEREEGWYRMLETCSCSPLQHVTECVKMFQGSTDAVFVFYAYAKRYYANFYSFGFCKRRSCGIHTERNKKEALARFQNFIKVVIVSLIHEISYENRQTVVFVLHTLIFLFIERIGSLIGEYELEKIETELEARESFYERIVSVFDSGSKKREKLSEQDYKQYMAKLKKKIMYNKYKSLESESLFNAVLNRNTDQNLISYTVRNIIVLLKNAESMQPKGYLAIFSLYEKYIFRMKEIELSDVYYLNRETLDIILYASLEEQVSQKASNKQSVVYILETMSDEFCALNDIYLILIPIYLRLLVYFQKKTNTTNEYISDLVERLYERVRCSWAVVFKNDVCNARSLRMTEQRDKYFKIYSLLKNMYEYKQSVVKKELISIRPSVNEQKSSKKTDEGSSVTVKASSTPNDGVDKKETKNLKKEELESLLKGVETINIKGKEEKKADKEEDKNFRFWKAVDSILENQEERPRRLDDWDTCDDTNTKKTEAKERPRRLDDWDTCDGTNANAKKTEAKEKPRRLDDWDTCDDTNTKKTEAKERPRRLDDWDMCDDTNTKKTEAKERPRRLDDWDTCDDTNTKKLTKERSRKLDNQNTINEKPNKLYDWDTTSLEKESSPYAIREWKENDSLWFSNLLFSIKTQFNTEKIDILTLKSKNTLEIEKEFFFKSIFSNVSLEKYASSALTTFSNSSEYVLYFFYFLLMEAREALIPRTEVKRKDECFIFYLVKNRSTYSVCFISEKEYVYGEVVVLQRSTESLYVVVSGSTQSIYFAECYYGTHTEVGKGNEDVALKMGTIDYLFENRRRYESAFAFVTGNLVTSVREYGCLVKILKENLMNSLRINRRERTSSIDRLSSCFDFFDPNSMEELLSRNKNYGLLNQRQQEVLRNSLVSNELFTLIQGPPGTGKTTLITTLINTLVNDLKLKVLVCTPSNTAVDELLRRSSKNLENIKTVRLGREELISEELRCYSVYKQAGITKHNTSKLFLARKKLIEESRIVFSTLSSAYYTIEMENTFDVLIVDECTQSVETSTIVPLMCKPKRVFLVGDPKQLPPVLLTLNREYELTLFERLSLFYKVNILTIQYRMNVSLCNFISKNFYDSLLTTDEGVAKREFYLANSNVLLEEAVRENAKKTGGSVGSAKSRSGIQPEGVSAKYGLCAFVNVEAQEERRFNSFFNEKETTFIVSLLSKMASKYAGVDVEESVGVISMYREQTARIRKRLSEDTKKEIAVDTVDHFQGQERDIIVVSCVRTNTIGFLRDNRRINVAFSRAKYLLVVVGCARNLKKQPMIGEFISHTKSMGTYYDLG